MKTRILRTVVRGCKNLVFKEFPTRRQLQMMAKHPGETAYVLRQLPPPQDLVHLVFPATEAEL